MPKVELLPFFNVSMGVFLVIGLSVYFYVLILILLSKESIAIYSYIGITLIFLLIYYLMSSKSNMENVDLEDMSFSEEWLVVAEDQVEARYLLSPIFMERVEKIQKCFRGKKVDCSFFNNSLLIEVYTNVDMFEITSLFRSALDYKKISEVVMQFYNIFSTIDVICGDRK